MGQKDSLSMKTADIDPSLRGAEPAPERLDDGFAPPCPPAPADAAPHPDEPPELALGTQSPF